MNIQLNTWYRVAKQKTNYGVWQLKKQGIYYFVFEDEHGAVLKIPRNTNGWEFFLPIKPVPFPVMSSMSFSELSLLIDSLSAENRFTVTCRRSTKRDVFFGLIGIGNLTNCGFGLRNYTSEMVSTYRPKPLSKSIYFDGEHVSILVTPSELRRAEHKLGLISIDTDREKIIASYPSEHKIS
jgi:hypothetical protein